MSKVDHQNKVLPIFFLIQNNVTCNSFLKQVVQTREHHLALWSGKRYTAKPSHMASSTKMVAFRSTRAVCTLFTPEWSFFHSCASPQTSLLTKLVGRETAITSQSWKITKRASVWRGETSHGW